MFRSPSYRIPTRVARCCLLLLVALTAGCAIQDDVTFNPYAPKDGDPTLMQTADRIVEKGEHVVRDLDTRLENTVY